MYTGSMALDFTTLYVIILLNSVSFAVVWALIAVSYRSMRAARYWFGALVMTCISGPLLVVSDGMPILTSMALTLVAGGFALMWQGVRVFHGRRPLWGAVAAIMAASLAALLVLGSSHEAVNLITAVSQIVPVSLAIVALLGGRPRYLGAYVAAGAAGLLVLGQGAEAVTNSLRLMGLMTTDAYYSVGAWFLVCAVIGGSVWNLGFLLMAADRLRSELKALATRDDLTGLPNRRGLRERIALCEKSVRRRQTSAVVMMIDLDRFKSINDRFGHAAGDAALVHIVTVGRNLLRDDDVLARISGDEFCTLLPHTELPVASGFARRLTDAIAAAPLFWKGQRIDLSVSIGLAEWRPGSSSGLAATLPLADAALLETKRNGRSGYTVYGQTLALAG